MKHTHVSPKDDWMAGWNPYALPCLAMDIVIAMKSRKKSGQTCITFLEKTHLVDMLKIWPLMMMMLMRNCCWSQPSFGQPNYGWMVEWLFAWMAWSIKALMLWITMPLIHTWHAFPFPFRIDIKLKFLFGCARLLSRSPLLLVINGSDIHPFIHHHH